MKKLEGRCSKNVNDATYRGHTCKRKAVRDGFCVQHHPDSVVARAKKRAARLDAREKELDRRRAARTEEGVAFAAFLNEVRLFVDGPVDLPAVVVSMQRRRIKEKLELYRRLSGV